MPEQILVKRKLAAIGVFRSYYSCTVPLSVVATHEHSADGHENTLLLIDTKDVQDPTGAHQQYHLREAAEEKDCQLKCFFNITHFNSRTFPMVVNQIVFIMINYNLLQLFLLR